MKKLIYLTCCLSLIVSSVLATTNQTNIGIYENATLQSEVKRTNQPGVSLIAFAIGFYNGYMDTRKEYLGGKETELKIVVAQPNDFSSFDN